MDFKVMDASYEETWDVSTTRNLFIENNVQKVVFDVITDGTPVQIFAFNADRNLLLNTNIEIPDSETSSPDYSPITSPLFNRVIVSPNFLRFKTEIDGTVTIRLRAIF